MDRILYPLVVGEPRSSFFNNLWRVWAEMESTYLYHDDIVSTYSTEISGRCHIESFSWWDVALCCPEIELTIVTGKDEVL